MKEFAIKHPIITFLLVDMIAYNAFVVIQNAILLFKNDGGDA